MPIYSDCGLKTFLHIVKCNAWNGYSTCLLFSKSPLNVISKMIILRQILFDFHMGMANMKYDVGAVFLMVMLYTSTTHEMRTQRGPMYNSTSVHPCHSQPLKSSLIKKNKRVKRKSAHLNRGTIK